MANWQAFGDAEPGLAREIEARFTARRHHTMATLRADGSPRISGIEVQFSGGELLLGMMGGSRKAGDLRRDGRLALHSATVDPDDGDPGGWPGEAKVTGTAVELTDPEDLAGSGVEMPGGSHLFRIELAEVVLTAMGDPPDHLDITLWRPGAPRRVFQRA